MTDNEVIKALECCKDLKCSECPKKSNLFVTDCDVKLCDEVLDLIKWQQEKIEKEVDLNRELFEKMAQDEAAFKELREQLDEQFRINRQIVRRNGEKVEEINRLKAEIETLESRIFALNDTNKILMETQEVYVNNKLEEFAERLKDRKIFLEDGERFIGYAVKEKDIDEVAKKMTEVKGDE